MKYSSFPILHDATQTYDTYLSYRRYAANINEGIVLVFDTGLSKLLETGSEASWKLTEELLSSEEIETFPAERLSAGMHSLGADFNIAMGGAMLNFDVKRAPVQASLTKLFEVFKKQDKAYLEDVMRQALKMYRDGFRNLKDETWAGDTLRLFLSLIEKFPQNALAYLYTAHLYHYQPRHLNFKRALEYYGLCFSCAAADVEQHLIGAQGCFYAGWISAVVFGNLDEAVELTNHALELDSTLSEAHYHLAKLYISQADIPRTIDHIKEAVSVDRRYCLKVVADDDFSLIKEDLRKYYFTVAEQDLAARSEELQRCSGDISDMMKMHTEDKLEYAKSLIESNSLKQLNEAIELLDGLQQRLEDEAAKQPEQEVEEPAMPAGEALEDSQGEGHSPSPEIDSTIEGIKENVKEARKERFEKEVLRRKGRNAMLSNMLLLFVVLTVTSGVVYGIHVISISLFGITNIIILLRVFFSSK